MPDGCPLRFTAAILITALTPLLGCSSGSMPPLIGDGTGRDSGTPFSGDSGPRDSAVDAPSSDATSTMPLGGVATVDEPNAPCVPSGGTKTTLFAASAIPGGAPASSLSTLGASRFAATSSGFYTFDPAGTNPTLVKPTLGSAPVFGSEGAAVGGTGYGGGAMLYQQYAATGATTGTGLTLATGLTRLPDGIWLGSGGGSSIAVWSEGGILSGAGVTNGASAGASWTLAGSAPGAFVAFAYNGSHFGIAWSSNPTPSTSQASFVLASPAGPMGQPVPIVSNGTTFTVAALTATPTGYALLAVGAGGDNHVYVLPLDSTGHALPPAHRLLGADAAWSIASFGAELGVVVSGNDVTAMSGEGGPRPPSFRPLDATGHALGPWVCLDTPVPMDVAQNMAIASDPGGYSVVYQSPVSDTVLVRFDHLGTGSQ